MPQQSDATDYPAMPAFFRLLTIVGFHLFIQQKVQTKFPRLRSHLMYSIFYLNRLM
jgi:hypothetical protein